uniref:uncharacterized protein LOC123453731 isoform X2 n=1 Tax=Jaculus jaculus TaxID=51337 RepID=UPI001E1B48F0|nr:uncharacterized protein LOC123453731 isoform X2 [Jaculus jaculus]
MDSPYGPDSSGGPDPLDGLDTHDGLDTCDGPDTTTVSDNLDGPDSPDGTDTSDGPHNPDGPDIPDGPDTTDGADIPVGSDNPHDPDTPDGPDTPYSLGTSDDPDPSDVPDTSEGPSTPIGPITSDGCSTSESPRVSHGPNAQDGPESPAPLAALLDPAISAEADVPAPLSVPADGPASPNAADYDDEEHALQVAKVVHTKEKNDKNESACPLEKVNKREITKSPLKKLVRPSTPKTSTAEMDKLMEVNGHPLSESTIRLERNDHAFPYKYLRKKRAYPLGKGNKSAITKSQLRELVSIPTPETSTAGMDSMMEINSLSASDSTVGMENKYKVVPYKRLKEVNNSENDITVIGNEEMEKHKGFLHLNWKLGTAHKKHIKRSEPPCPLAEEKKSENSKFTTRESVSASTSERSPVETDTAQQAQVDGSHVPGDLHHTGRRKERAYPLGKGNKSAITKSQLRELVSIPTPETSTAGMDSMMEINSLSASDSTVGKENKYKVVPYKRLKEVNNSENDITVIGNEEMEKHKGFLHLNWKLGTAHKKHIKRSEPPCPLAEEKKSENSKFTTRESVSASTSERSPVETDTAQQAQVDGSHVPGDLHHTGRRKERAYPLGKGNKSAITKSQLRELVSIPTPETSTAGMDSMMEINSLSASDSTVGMENKYKVVPYKRLKEVNNSENDITVIGNEEMEKHKGFLHLNWKLGTAHKKHIKRSEPPCPLAEEKKSENSKFTTRESVSASTSERSPVETDTAQQAQVDGSHVPGDLHHTGRRKERAYPLGKGNKSAITKSQLRELVSIPTPETSTAGMDSMMEINSLSASGVSPPALWQKKRKVKTVSSLQGNPCLHQPVKGLLLKRTLRSKRKLTAVTCLVTYTTPGEGLPRIHLPNSTRWARELIEGADDFTHSA